jgi:hypothetical protein
MTIVCKWRSKLWCDLWGVTTLANDKNKAETKHIYSTGVTYGRHLQSSLMIVKIYL